jgi:hypothetical protein
MSFELEVETDVDAVTDETPDGFPELTEGNPECGSKGEAVSIPLTAKAKFMFPPFVIVIFSELRGDDAIA